MTTTLIDAAAQLLPPALLAFWVLAAGAVVVTLLPLPLPRAFKDAVRLSAARGKLWEGRPASLGPLSHASVPQSWFLHFYVIGAICNALAAAACLAAVSRSSNTKQSGDLSRSLLVLAAFQVHLVRRAVETAAVMRYPPSARMHVIAYAFGLAYYIVMPLSLLPTGQFRGIAAAATAMGSVVARPSHAVAALAAALTAAPAVARLGLVLFGIGNTIQFHSHHLLARLQKRKGKAPAAGDYYIPRGGMFRFVSCPHYFGEIVIYAGLFVASGGRLLPGLALFWVVVNLVLAADATHAWYLRTFAAYPKRRRALVPFIY